ncbi:MAG: hypothetical protein SFX72_21110 [Isosphaeraceae bacterium]|nr:hypothetical protein [Isosphaeraceae bacterium]
MQPIPRLALSLLFLVAPASALFAADKAADAVVDKAIAALGGAEKLAKAANHRMTSKGSIVINGEKNSVSSKALYSGIDRMRADLELNVGGNLIDISMVLNKTTGRRRLNDNEMESEGAQLANDFRNLFLHQTATTLLPLREKGVELKALADEMVGGKPAAVIEVVAPESKKCRIAFDKESGLPVRLTAEVMGFQGETIEQEVEFADYKESGGVKKAMKVTTKRGGEPFIESEVLTFDPVERVDDEEFSKLD